MADDYSTHLCALERQKRLMYDAILAKRWSEALDHAKACQTAVEGIIEDLGRHSHVQN